MPGNWQTETKLEQDVNNFIGQDDKQWEDDVKKDKQDDVNEENGNDGVILIYKWTLIAIDLKFIIENIY